MNHGISSTQMYLMVVNFTVGSSLLMAAGLTLPLADRNAWLAMGTALTAGILLNLIMLYLLKKYNFSSVYVIFDHVAGKWGGLIISIIFIFSALYLCSLIIMNLTFFLTLVAIPEMPGHVFQIMSLILVIYSASKGLQNLGRVSEASTPFILVIIFLTFIFILNKFNLDLLRPVLNEGIIPVFQASYSVIGFPFIELILLYALFPYVTRKKRLIPIFLSGMILAGFTLIIAIIFTIGVEGSVIAGRQPYATYSMARHIEIGELFQRVEAAIGIVWILSLIIKILIAFMVALFGLQHISRKTSYTSFILPASIIIWAMSNHLHTDIVDFAEFVAVNWTFYWMTIYIIVLMVLVSGVIFKKHHEL
ncbi:endospore germination permease [Evansella sp. LMS18]|uniref:GerAB/ArcD/ProY family transporter n=1 Tax=Evansella sp. LMS18 TaxID=2924033 RepID=UPI0020D19785|nr:endospore germination permease [Evansella sp. LMS18]UTR10233.1 endospore germination permease [Evansella sp. LMS18]